MPLNPQQQIQINPSGDKISDIAFSILADDALGDFYYDIVY